MVPRAPPLPLGRRGLVLIVLLTLSVALAGCGALSGPEETPSPTQSAAPTPAGTTSAPPTPTTPSTQTASASDPPETATDEASASLSEKGIDPAATWNRTLRVVGVNATRPPVRLDTESVSVRPEPFFSMLTGASNDASDGAAAYYDPHREVIVLHEDTVRTYSRAELETILAHEYAHAIQYQHGWTRGDAGESGRAETLALGAYSEGFATYVHHRYAARYPEATAPRNLTATYEEATTYERYSLGRYRFGNRHFERQVNETGSLAAAAATPPATTEQIIHGTSETPRRLDVRMNKSDDWITMPARPRGELLTRIVLRDELAKERAVRAARGWGADRFYRVGSTPLGGSIDEGFVWVHRWDTTTDAAEFASAAEAFVDNRSAETDEYAFETKRVAPETTMLVYGKPAVTANMTVTAASNESVTVRLGN